MLPSSLRRLLMLLPRMQRLPTRRERRDNSRPMPLRLMVIRKRKQLRSMLRRPSPTVRLLRPQPRQMPRRRRPMAKRKRRKLRLMPRSRKPRPLLPMQVLKPQLTQKRRLPRRRLKLRRR